MPKLSVEYIKQPVPSFLQKFKQETGFQEHSLADKQEAIREDPDTGDRQDERPQVVQLSKSDLTAEEAKKHWDSELTEDKPGSSVQEDDKNPEEKLEEESGGRIMFKKPTKRSSNELLFNANKKKKKEVVKKEKSKGLKNTKLLSFECEDEEDT